MKTFNMHCYFMYNLMMNSKLLNYRGELYARLLPPEGAITGDILSTSLEFM